MRRCAFAAAAALGLAGGATQAQVIIDQQYIATPTAGFGSFTQAPVGQSFTPTLASLNFVRLTMSDNTVNGVGASFQLTIRQGEGTGGAVLGTSAVLALPDNFGGSTFPGASAEFFFPTPVALVPNTLNTFLLTRLSGIDDFLVYAVSPGGGYAGGNGIASGFVFTSVDLLFREGIGAVPEPSSLALLGLAAAGFAVRRWRRATVTPPALLALAVAGLTPFAAVYAQPLPNAHSVINAQVRNVQITRDFDGTGEVTVDTSGVFPGGFAYQGIARAGTYSDGITPMSVGEALAQISVSGAVQATATSSLDAYGRVAATQPSPSGYSGAIPVLVRLVGEVSVTGPANSPTAGAVARATVNFNGLIREANANLFSGPQSAGFDITQAYSFSPGAQFRFILTASANGGTTAINPPTAGANAYADPVFQFDQATFNQIALAQGFPTYTLADYYSFEFSPGLTPVPEPTALALSSLGAIGLAGRVWRRRRQRMDRSIP